MIAALGDCLALSLADWANSFCLKSLSIEVLLVSKRKSPTAALGAWFEFLWTFGACALAYGTGLLRGVLGLDDGSVVDVADRDRNGEFEGGRFALIPWVFRIPLVDAGHFLYGTEDILTVPLVLLPLFVVGESVICCVN